MIANRPLEQQQAQLQLETLQEQQQQQKDIHCVYLWVFEEEKEIQEEETEETRCQRLRVKARPCVGNEGPETSPKCGIKVAYTNSTLYPRVGAVSGINTVVASGPCRSTYRTHTCIDKKSVLKSLFSHTQIR